MPYSDKLRLPLVAKDAPQWDQACNDALKYLEDSVNCVKTLDMAGGDRTLAPTEELRSFIFVAKNVTGQHLILSTAIDIFTDLNRFISVANTGPGDLHVKTDSGSFTDTVPAEGRRLYFISGTDVYILSSFGTSTQTASMSYEASVFIADQPSAGNKEVLRLPIAQDVTFSGNFSGSRASCRLLPAADAIFTVKRNNTPIGDVTFKADGNHVFTTINGGSPIQFTAGQVLTIESPTAQDASLADVGINLYGVKD
jgi:hypothetical protein